jgi:heptosyltransferase I
MPKQASSSTEDSLQSICILRLSAIGDVTHVLPVVNALQALKTQPEITWVVGKLEAKLLAGVAGVNFIVFDKSGGMDAVRQLKKSLKPQRFDILLHMQVALRANLLSRYIKADTTIGWDKPRWRDRHQWFINQSVRSVPQQHQVDGFLEFARVLGAEPGPPVWKLPISEKDQHWADDILARGPDAGKPVLMISPCSSHSLRNWAAERYAAVANHAISNLGMRVVLVGGPSELEKNTGASIEAGVLQPVQNLIAKDTITQSVALLKRASIVISPDSGPAHIASCS